MIRQQILKQDASSIWGNWFHLPHMVLLALFYIKALVKLIITPQYQSIIVNTNHTMYENHLSNYAILKRAPVTWMITSHMLMAIFWVLATISQKLLVRAMANGYNLSRKIHIILGTCMCAVSIFGCSVGGFIAYSDHNHSPMRWFLMLLPCSFLPSIIMTYINGKNRNIINHRFWATSAFIGPCLSSLWAEELIYRFGRQTQLGPWTGELWGTGIAGFLHIIVIILPAWFVRRQQLSSYQQGKNSETSDQDKTLILTDSAAPIPQRVKSE